MSRPYGLSHTLLVKGNMSAVNYCSLVFSLENSPKMLVIFSLYHFSFSLSSSLPLSPSISHTQCLLLLFLMPLQSRSSKRHKPVEILAAVLHDMQPLDAFHRQTPRLPILKNFRTPNFYVVIMRMRSAAVYQPRPSLLLRTNWNIRVMLVGGYRKLLRLASYQVRDSIVVYGLLVLCTIYDTVLAIPERLHGRHGSVCSRDAGAVSVYGSATREGKDS